jgi:hypothetical protein
VAKRATWVWDRPDATELVTWATGHDVRELFLAVGAGIGNSPDLPWVRSVVGLAHAAGIRVAALGGDAGWHERPGDALGWSQDVLGTNLFDGVHLDVEPWTRTDWDQRRPALVALYLDLLLRLAGDCPLPIEADLSHGLHEVPTQSAASLDAAVMDIVDAVTVMSFRNLATGPDSITAIGGPSLAVAERVGLRCRLAVETNYLGPDPVARKQTFYGMDRASMDRAMANVDAVESGLSSYNGIAVQDYAGWRALRTPL